MLSEPYSTKTEGNGYLKGDGLFAITVAKETSSVLHLHIPRVNMG